AGRQGGRHGDGGGPQPRPAGTDRPAAHRRLGAAVADRARRAAVPDGGRVGVPVRRRWAAALRWPLFSATRAGARRLRIYKILSRSEWAAAHEAGRFAGSGIDLADGYIHFSTAAQAQETARRHFAGRAD